MGRIVFRLCAFSTLLLSGCATMATVAAVPGVLIEDTVHFFRGQKESLPASMQRSLASVQQGLRRMDLDVDVLEPVEGGYAIQFGNEKLDGTMELKRQTPRLTTISIIVYRGVSRQHSVEQTIVNVVRDVSGRRDAQKKFNFRGYGHARIQPSMKARRIGWYRDGALLEVGKSGEDGWIRIKMPSGGWGYLKRKFPEQQG